METEQSRRAWDPELEGEWGCAQAEGVSEWEATSLGAVPAEAAFARAVGQPFLI